MLALCESRLVSLDDDDDALAAPPVARGQYCEGGSLAPYHCNSRSRGWATNDAPTSSSIDASPPLFLE